MIFSKLPRRAQRAAFANMTARKKATAAAKPSATSSAAAPKKKARNRFDPKQTSQVINPKPGGGFEITGRITREEAAIKMFGRAGATARIAKANKRRKK